MKTSNQDVPYTKRGKCLSESRLDMRKWHESFEPIAKHSNAQPKRMETTPDNWKSLQEILNVSVFSVRFTNNS